MLRHGYQDRSSYCFWRDSISSVRSRDVDPVVAAKFKISKLDKIATAGSCFAQHLARHLRRAGFTYFVTEEAHPLIPPNLVEEYGYGVFSARYANIYTSRQLVQVLQRAYGLFQPDEDIWKGLDGRFLDPFRPRIQPNGFASEAEFYIDRDQHFKAIRRAVEELDVLVFTLGLTEAWISTTSGAAYPLCPGVAGGTFDPLRYAFVNLKVAEIVEDLRWAFNFIREKNKNSRFILTVSPVPLAATAEDRSVLVSTIYSKSVLRVAAEEVSKTLDDVAYFPSYEIITGSYNRGSYFAADLRSVTEAGIEHVMRLFMKYYAGGERPSVSASSAQTENEADNFQNDMMQIAHVICEEEMLANARSG